MNKKLIAVAVAGLFAAPAVALAQSSVTISGNIKGGLENLKLSNNAARTANNSQHGLGDDSSALVFSVTEDLGGGMQAVVRLDFRIKPDDNGPPSSAAGHGGGAYNPGAIVAGNSHFGLRSNQWGRIIFGRQDLHYFNTESNITDKGSLRTSPISILSYVSGVGAGGVGSGATAAIATASRTANVIHYLSPNWSGFTFILAYSTNPGATEGDIGSGTRKGSAWNFNPNFAAANWQIGYSYYAAKPDGGGTATTGLASVTVPAPAAFPAPIDQRGDRLYGSYVFPFGLKIGLAWDKSKLKSTTGAGDVARRDAWSLPVSYAWGNHTVHVNYSKANDDKVQAGAQGADLWALAYSYDLSKRTSVALTYARMNNKSADGTTFGGGNYNLFTSSSIGVGTSAGAVARGEDQKMFGLTMRHSF